MSSEMNLQDKLVQEPLVMARFRARDGGLKGQTVVESAEDFVDIVTRNYQHSPLPKVLAGVDAVGRAIVYEVAATVRHVAGVVSDAYDTVTGRPIREYLEWRDRKLACEKQ